jgi:hypothetical protein
MYTFGVAQVAEAVQTREDPEVQEPQDTMSQQPQ